MSNPGRKSEPPKQPREKPEEKSKKPRPSRHTEDDDEDGDIATPKRDRHGPDDEPL